MKVVRCWLVVGALFRVSAAQASEDGDDKQRCIEGYEGTQEAERAQNLLKARELALMCSAEICHPLMKESCSAWLSALGAKIPKVRVTVKGERGEELVGVELVVDDAMTVRGSGRELELDPGAHSVTAKHADYAATTKTFQLAEGQRDAVVELRLTLASRVPAAPSSSVSLAASSAPPLWPAFVLGGVGLAGFATLGVFGVIARDADSALDRGPDACAKTLTCSPERLNGIQTDYTIANVGLVVGAVFATSAIGYTIYSVASRPARAEVSLLPSGVLVRGHF